MAQGTLRLTMAQALVCSVCNQCHAHTRDLRQSVIDGLDRNKES